MAQQYIDRETSQPGMDKVKDLFKPMKPDEPSVQAVEEKRREAAKLLERFGMIDNAKA